MDGINWSNAVQRCLGKLIEIERDRVRATLHSEENQLEQILSSSSAGAKKKKKKKKTEDVREQWRFFTQFCTQVMLMLEAPDERILPTFRHLLTE